MRIPIRITAMGIAATAVAVALIACSPSAADAGADPRRADDGLLLSDPEDAALIAAKAEAMKTLPIFWEKLVAASAGYDDFALKVGFKVKGGGTEHVWTRPVRREGDQLVVRLANKPEYIAKLKLGSEVRVLATDVSDWAYAYNGKLYGHFTTRALMANATSRERAELEGVLAPTPLEPELR